MRVYAYLKSTEEFFKEYESIAQAERDLKISNGTVSRALRSRTRQSKGYLFSHQKADKFPDILANDSKPKTIVHKPNGVIQNAGISLKDFENKFDPIEIIRREVKKLDRKYMIPNADFIRNCKFPPGVAYRDYLEASEFEIYCGRVGSSIFWSHPETIEYYKNLGKLL